MDRVICAAGVSPSQAPAEDILRVDLYGTAVLLEAFGRIAARGGAGLVVSPQSERRMFAAGSDFLMDGGATASSFYGDLRILRARIREDGRAV